MINPENAVDRERFDKLRNLEISRGRPEEEATEIAAREVKVLREREGRDKQDGEPAPDAPDRQ
jgi:hypothetical protein